MVYIIPSILRAQTRRSLQIADAIVAVYYVCNIESCCFVGGGYLVSTERFLELLQSGHSMYGVREVPNS